MTSPVDVIRQQAQKYDFAELARRLQASLDTLGEHLSGLRQEQADFKPNESQWSIGEVVHHVALSVRGMIQIVNKLNCKQEFKRPMNRSDMGVTQGGVSVETLRQDWQTLRQDLQAKLSTITPPLNTEATRAHIDFGPLNSMEWLALNYLHTRRHHEQIQRIKSADGFPK